MGQAPTYLRVVATTRCNHHCDYCHMEGDPHAPGTSSELPTPHLLAGLHAAVLAGVKKFKFLGGEPLLRRDLPEVVAALRALAPDADMSVITAGVVPVERLHTLYAAGLTRVNVSIHGWRPEALAANISVRDAWTQRQRFLEAAIERRRWGGRFRQAQLRVDGRARPRRPRRLSRLVQRAARDGRVA
jgi:cyclic pyranopterin phosphate synthase